MKKSLSNKTFTLSEISAIEKPHNLSFSICFSKDQTFNFFHQQWIRLQVSNSNLCKLKHNNLISIIFTDTFVPKILAHNSFSSDGWLHNLSKIFNIHSIYVAILMILLTLLALVISLVFIICFYHCCKKCQKNYTRNLTGDEAHLISDNEVMLKDFL